MSEIINISIGSKIAETKNVKETKVSGETDSKSSKDFFSIMFSQIKKNIKSETATTENLEKNILKNEPKIDLSSDKTKKSLDDHLLNEVLEVISLLKNETPKTSFPKYSTKIEKLLSDEVAIKDFKEVKNIADLMKLSQKYELGLEKISAKQVDMKTIKEEFPLLEKKAFFEVPKQQEKEVKNTFLDTKKSEIKSSEIPFNAIEKPKVKNEKEPSILERLITKESPKTEPKVKITEEKIDIKEKVVAEKVVEVKNTAIKEEKVEIKKSTNEIKISQEIKESPKEIVKEKDEKKVEVKTPTIKEEVEEAPIKESVSTRVNEPKIEQNTNKRGFAEVMLQGLKADKPLEVKKAEQPLMQTNMSEKQSSETSSAEATEIKTENVTNKNDVRVNTKQDFSTKQTGITRETFSSFADDLREKIEQYKPPIMKIQMALNPKALGEVDVTIVNRGNNLHVSINSNTSTMSLFTQNQAEFKNSLVNMGFTNLEMNFSDQRQSNNEQGKNSSSTNKEFFEELEEETSTSIELIVPQYV